MIHTAPNWCLLWAEQLTISLTKFKAQRPDRVGKQAGALVSKASLAPIYQMYNKQMMLEGPVSKDYSPTQYPTPNPRYKNSHPTFLQPALTLSRPTAHWPPHCSKAGKCTEASAAALAIQCMSSALHGPCATTLHLCLQRVAWLQLLLVPLHVGAP
jgi:hypothetical protein